MPSPTVGVLLRMPPELHQAILERADAAQQSFSAYVIAVLAKQAKHEKHKPKRTQG